MAVGGGILAVIGGTGDDNGNPQVQRQPGVREMWEVPSGGDGWEGSWDRVRELSDVGSSAGQEALSEPASDVPPEPEPLSGVEAAICAYPWECSIALRVARCESGPDYAAGYNASGHAGTFQISPIHQWRFAARGLDFWSDATVAEWNLDVAYEIWTERWWYAWSCF